MLARASRCPPKYLPVIPSSSGEMARRTAASVPFRTLLDALPNVSKTILVAMREAGCSELAVTLASSSSYARSKANIMRASLL